MIHTFSGNHEAHQKGTKCVVDWQKRPEVEYPDLYNYLIETPVLKRAFKSLDGYRLYSYGWIQKEVVYKEQWWLCVVTARQAKRCTKL